MKSSLFTLICAAGFAGSALCGPLASDDFASGGDSWKLHWDVTKADPGAAMSCEADPDDASNQCLVLAYNTGGGALDVAAVNTASLGNATPKNPQNVVLRFRARSNQSDPRKVRIWITDSADKSVLAYSSRPLTMDWTEFEIPLAKEKLGGRDKGAELMWPLTMISIQFSREGGGVGERPEKVWIDDVTLSEE